MTQGSERLRRRKRYDVVFYMPQMSSLLVAETDQVPPGGAETQVQLLATRLAASGLQVALVVLPHEELPRSVDGIDVIARPRSFVGRRGLGKLLEVAAVAWALLPIRTSIFVQRAAGFDTGLVGMAARARGSRFVYASASVVDFEFGRLERRRRNLAIYRLGVRLANPIVVQTPEQVGLCEARFGRTPVMIKSLAASAPRRSSPPRAFLWIGRLTYYKRPLEFVELARALPEAKFEIVAVPVGREAESLSREIEARAATMENLTVLEPRPRSELAELIASAVAVVNTSDYEGMPNIFLEGWARGVPALALSHDPDGVIERERLGGFAAGSPTRLGELARAMWESRDEQIEIAERCRAYVEREHSPEAGARQWREALGFGPESERGSRKA